MIEVTDVRVVYNRTIALDGVTLAIGPGVTGVYGPNGSGKSTLLRVLSGLLRPTRGRISFDGVPRHPADESLRRRIGYAGHDAGLYGRLSVRENLELFAALSGGSRARIPEILDTLDLTERGTSRVDELSAGFKRRASIARALVHDPDILLLDEPFATLDDDAAERVTSAITAWRAPGRTAVIATHGAKRLKSLAEGTIVLRRGLVVTDRQRAIEVGA
jgi:heme exporter protein A